MKKITKRITALIIAAMMLASMIPAAFAATGAETVKEKYEFLFTRASHADAFTTKNDKGNLTYTPKDCSLDNTIQGDKWANVNGWYAYGYSVKEDYISYYYEHQKERGGGYIYDPDNGKYPAFMALEILIDEPGTYSPSLTWEAHNQSPYVDVFLIPKIEEDVATWTYTTYKEEPKKACYAKLVGFSPIGTVKMQPTDDSGDVSPKELSPIKIADGDEGSYYLIFVPNKASENVAKTLDGGEKCYIQPASFSLTRVAAPAEPEEDTEISGAFTPDNIDTDADYTEPTVIAISKEGVEGITAKSNGNGTHTVTAPEKNKAGKKFLYWAKGLTAQKKILLYKTNELTDYLPDEEYANYLIPVYEDDISGDEYYNANGQLIPGANQETRVSMPGYDESIGWNKYGENIYVAKYELAKPVENIEITKKGDYTLNKEGKYAYGEPVTCTATGETFKCWKKDNEIVGTDTTYTFKAWESCTVEAVYATHVPYTGEKMKIIIDDFVVGSETGVMAEFIGLDDAVEKGIMFTDSDSNTSKIAMTTKDNQFTVIADEPGKYIGYAILKSGDNAFTLITDGEYAKQAE